MPSEESRDVHGILLFDKPQGVSSNHALQTVRRLYGAPKAGHTGSLDPMATGLLPICFGEATKIAGLLLGSRKAYDAECRLGATTDTEDAEGRIVLERPIDAAYVAANLDAALAALTGHIVQVPPAYSAIKRGGEPMYRRARRGETVTVPPREVDVYRFEIVESKDDRLRLHIECGSGTYVRSLVRDLGERLGCGAHLTALRRLWIEPFMQPAMRQLDELHAIAEQGGASALDALLLPLEDGLAGYSRLELDDDSATRLRHGQLVFVRGATGFCLAVDPAGKAVALVECGTDGCLRSRRGFNRLPGA